MKPTLESLTRRFTVVRLAFPDILQRLRTEEFDLQVSNVHSSPHWHFGHVSALFAYGLKPWLEYSETDFLYWETLNSYYLSLGKPIALIDRQKMTQPTMDEASLYYNQTNSRVHSAIWKNWSDPIFCLSLELCIQHQEQHQELLLQDIKAFRWATNQLPFAASAHLKGIRVPTVFIEYEGGKKRIGADCTLSEFAFDNESSRHYQWLNPYRLANRLVTNGEYLTFIEKGGYDNSHFWLSNGWLMKQREQWLAPLYWVNLEGKWHEWTLGGLQLLQLNHPVTHVSFFEANAYANFVGKRLPTEFEWEASALLAHSFGKTHTQIASGQFYESGYCHPLPRALSDEEHTGELFGKVWQWTQSSYLPYHGFTPNKEVPTECSGTFMDGCYVLRGGSCLTPIKHYRLPYRNFYTPESRYPMTGFRLADN